VDSRASAPLAQIKEPAMHSTLSLDPTRFLTRRELAGVLADAKSKPNRN